MTDMSLKLLPTWNDDRLAVASVVCLVTGVGLCFSAYR